MITITFIQDLERELAADVSSPSYNTVVSTSRIDEVQVDLSSSKARHSLLQENTGQVPTDNEGDLDRSRTHVLAADSEEKRQLLDSYVKNQLTLQCKPSSRRMTIHDDSLLTVSERLLGGSRCVARSKPPTVTTIQNRTLLDIRAIQPPAQNLVTCIRLFQQRSPHVV